MILVVDYRAGNIRSVTKALESLGAETRVSNEEKDVLNADKIVLPGVGAFGKAVDALNQLNLMGSLREVIQKSKPFLGICLGFQIFFAKSEENPDSQGLAVVDGMVKRFEPGLKVPHLGWNRVLQKRDNPLWKGIPDNSYFYFAHSYFNVPEDKNLIAGTTEYGIEFVSAIVKGNLFGVQFHPEKSQKWGLRLLKNFIEI